MPQHTHARRRRCPDCHGFPRVKVTTGDRNPDGTRRTITLTCQTCQGAGSVPRPASALRMGR